MKTIFRVLVFSMPCLIIFLGNVNTAWSATVTLGESGWLIDFDNTKVTGVTISGFAGDDKKTGGIKLTKSFAATGEIDIKFIEVNPALADDFGLRVKSLAETIKNTSNNMNLTGYTLELIDPNPELVSRDPAGNILGKNDNVVGNHPGFAHFHKDAGQNKDAGQTFAPFTPNPNPAGIGALQGKKITLVGGTIGAGQSADWTGIGIHQIEEKAQQRNFMLRQTAVLAPIPLPATLWLIGTGAVALLGFGRRRKGSTE